MPKRALTFLLLPALCLAQAKRIRPVDQAEVASFEKHAKIALLVGIGNYPADSGLNPLKYPSSDVAAMQAQLKKSGYLVRTLVETAATRGVVRRVLRELADAVDPNEGTLAFYFTGHGFTQGKENYLATFGVSADDLASDGLPLREVEQILTGSKAKRQLMWIDACRNDPTAKAGKGADARSFAALNAAEGLRVLFSTRTGRFAYESDKLQHGVFTHYLVKGLQGEAAKEDGLVTFRDLADYVINGVRAFGVEQGQLQVPYEAGESSGDFLLAKVVAGPMITPPVVIPETPRGPRVGDAKTNPRDGQRYMYIPAGRFRMGCSDGDTQCFGDEKPAHEVEISRGFWLGQTEVTVEAFERYRKAANVPALQDKDSFGRQLNTAGDLKAPAVAMTWDEASGYCSWIGGRLPTEAEWEYAARAGSRDSRYGALDQVAWYGDNSGKQRLDSLDLWKKDSKSYVKKLFDNGNGLKRVGGLAPNAWGLYDMLGNAWEWTADWYGEKYYQGSEARDPQGPPSGDKRVLRGGSWDDDPAIVRSSYRFNDLPGDRLVNIGFRCLWE